MSSYYLAFRSLTYAQRAELLLGHHGITCHLTRTPKSSLTTGCSYSVRLPERHASRAECILRVSGIPIIAVLKQAVPGESAVVQHDLS